MVKGLVVGTSRAVGGGRRRALSARLAAVAHVLLWYLYAADFPACLHDIDLAKTDL